MRPEHARNVLAHIEAGTPILAGCREARKKWISNGRWSPISMMAFPPCDGAFTDKEFRREDTTCTRLHIMTEIYRFIRKRGRRYDYLDWLQRSSPYKALRLLERDARRALEGDR